MSGSCLKMHSTLKLQARFLSSVYYSICRKVLAVILGLFQFLFAKILPFLLQGISFNECKCEGRFEQFSTTALFEVFDNFFFQSKAIAYCSDLSFKWCVYSCTYTLLQKSFEASHYMNLTAFIRRIWSEFERKISDYALFTLEMISLIYSYIG